MNAARLRDRLEALIIFGLLCIGGLSNGFWREAAEASNFCAPVQHVVNELEEVAAVRGG